jgi:hypothetical protein
MSEFMSNTIADFLGSVLAGMVLVGLYMLIQWFLAATDVEIGYSWPSHGLIGAPNQLWVSLDVRNRSRSRTYYIANIAYMKGARPVAAFDNKSVWGAELKPGTIRRDQGAVRDEEREDDVGWRDHEAVCGKFDWSEYLFGQVVT